MEDDERTKKIAELNDLLRTTFSPEAGEVFMTAGINALDERTRSEIIAAVMETDHHPEASDPRGEHDFGVVDVGNKKVFWKIDYYDVARQFHSPDPADPAVTRRVLTILLSSEW